MPRPARAAHRRRLVIWIETLAAIALACLAAFCLLGLEDTHHDSTRENQ